jgi:acyl-coenzyme A synthetase/AMP-(fatty) acid ligase
VAYGQTEASPRITYLGPLEVLSNPESSGRPLPGVLVQILAEDGSELPTVEDLFEIKIAVGESVIAAAVFEDTHGNAPIRWWLADCCLRA